MSLKRLYGLYASATVDELRAGRAWYDEARAYACELSERFDVPHEVAAGVLACLSPNSKWERNKLDATAVLQGVAYGLETGDMSAAYHATKVSTYNPNKVKAWTIAEYGNAADVVSGPKVTAFYQNILGDSSELTLDSHAYNAWCGRRATGSDLPGIPAGLRRQAIADYRCAANVKGETVSAFQAIIWVRWKRKIETSNVKGYQR